MRSDVLNNAKWAGQYGKLDNESTDSLVEGRRARVRNQELSRQGRSFDANGEDKGVQMLSQVFIGA